MGNVISSLNVVNLESLAKAIDGPRSDPSAILDSVNTHSRKLASSLLDAIKAVRQDPSAALESLYAHSYIVVASLLNAVIGANGLITKLLDSFKNNWYRVVALLPITKKKIFAVVAAWWIPFTVILTLACLLGGFGRAGVRKNSPASKFQSWNYGGHTPRGGIFASSTRSGMKGSTPIIYKVTAIVVASFITVVVYKSLVTK